MWAAVTGYRFDAQGAQTHGPADSSTRLRLTPSRGRREGIRYAVIEDRDVSGTRRRLSDADVTFTDGFDDAGELVRLDVDPAYLNGFEISYRRSSR